MATGIPRQYAHAAIQAEGDDYPGRQISQTGKVHRGVEMLHHNGLAV